ncbi:MAG: hypothetical protein M1837_003723 [Sclerophora amabilis]|nr:MAG: hypothetical protein M1837_003723 [Sclerophora amabilis]
MDSQQPVDYSNWSHDSLIRRVEELEYRLKHSTSKFKSYTSPAPRPKHTRTERKFDPSKYSTRHIALKLAYLGQRYNGFEHHANNETPLPTIEEELYKALSKARLIYPGQGHAAKPGEVNWEGCEYSKCGRTDRGVSAFGQVISLRVRSNRPLARRRDKGAETKIREGQDSYSTLVREETLEVAAEPSDSESNPGPSDLHFNDPDCEDYLSFDPVKDELPYSQILNRILPDDIRILAWSPTLPVDFSARFSCRERRYKYFFTQPAFAPVPGIAGLLPKQGQGERKRIGWLDIDAMREGARHFIGLHDFRNFCKVDPSKQITNFQRRIFHADIEEIDPMKAPVSYFGGPEFRALDTEEMTSKGADARRVHPPLKVYTFTLHGSAFLWHQVRHMVAILFLVGQGLEMPSLIPQLLDVDSNPAKPQYEMASDAPLVLWDCIFPCADDEGRKDAMEWVYVGDNTGVESGASKVTDGKFGPGCLIDNVWSIWRSKKIDEVLAGSLLDLIAGQGRRDHASDASDISHMGSSRKLSQKVFRGGDMAKTSGKYVPVLQKPRTETVEIINQKYADRKMFETNEESKEGPGQTFKVENDAALDP